MKYIDNYLEVLEVQDEILKLNEVDLSQLISKLTPEAKTKALTKKMESNIDPKDPIKSLKRVKSMLSFLPQTNLKTIDNYIGSKTDEFKGLKKMASVIIGNSLPEISDTSKEFASTFVALSSFVAKKGEQTTPKDNLKKQIKDFVIRARKFIDEHEPTTTSSAVSFQKEDLPDLAVAWVIVAMTTSLAVSLGFGGYFLLTTIFPQVIWVAVAFAVTIGILQAQRGRFG